MFVLRDLFKMIIHLKPFHSVYPKRKIHKLSAKDKPILYGDIISPPVRFVLMTASALNADLDFHKIDLFRSEHKSEFYTKINPLQKIPALSVQNEVIKDSHAIAKYLCKIYDNRELYPDDALSAAKVDEMLFFNADALFPLDSAIFTAYFAGKGRADEERSKHWISMLDYMENVLINNKWLAGEKMLLCDICCVATVSSLGILMPPLDRHKKVKEWMEKLQALPFYKINNEGLNILRHFVDLINQSGK